MRTKKSRIKERRTSYRAKRRAAVNKPSTDKIVLRWAEVENASRPIVLVRNHQPIAVVIKYAYYRRLAQIEPRETSSREREDFWRSELAAMAADPEIQKELQMINQEFARAETDGLDKI